MRAAIYLRQSVDGTDGIDRQRGRTKALVKSRDWQLVGEYADNDTSASKSRAAGTEWARLLEDLRAKKVDAVVAVDLDRLLRTTRDLNTLIDLGAKVVTVDGDIDLSTADGEFRATMLAGIARFEVRRKSERQQRANAQRVDQGRRTGGSRRQFGYAKDGVTVIENEAKAIRDGYELLLSGVPLAAIARDWNQRGLVTTQKRQARSGHAGEPSPWAAYSVRSVLTNPRNAGIVTYGPMVDHEETPQKRVASLRVEKPGVVAAWPAIVEESTFRAAESVLADPSRRTGGTSGKYLLTGIAKCGIEGCGAGAHAGGNARPGVRAYRCSGSLGHFARKAVPVDEYVEGLVIARLSKPDARELLVKQGEDTKALRRQMRAVDQDIRKLVRYVFDKTFTEAEVKSESARLHRERAHLEERVADAGRVNVLGPIIGASDVAKAWAGLDINRQRAVVDVLMDVTLHPVGRGTRTFRTETVGIDWKS
jgi:site-specific DNA recombinase